MGTGSSLDKASDENQEQTSNNAPPQGSHSETKDKLVSLPYSCEAILRHVDSAVDRSSTEKLLEQLHAGVFLKGKKEKYWVEKESNRNCFILFAQDLSITWAEDNRFWHWPLLKESNDSDESNLVPVAELRNVCWLEVHGKFEMGWLTPETVYQVVFVMQLKDPAYGWEVPVNVRLTLPDGTKQEHRENLMEKPRGKWVEIQAGEIKASAENVGEIEFSMFEYEGGKWKRGLFIKGVKIKPKASVT